MPFVLRWVGFETLMHPEKELPTVGWQLWVLLMNLNRERGNRCPLKGGDAAASPASRFLPERDFGVCFPVGCSTFGSRERGFSSPCSGVWAALGSCLGIGMPFVLHGVVHSEWNFENDDASTVTCFDGGSGFLGCSHWWSGGRLKRV